METTSELEKAQVNRTGVRRKQSKDGTFRGGARPGAGRKPGTPRPGPETPPIEDDVAYAADLLSRTMRDQARPLQARITAAVAILGRSTATPTTPDARDEKDRHKPLMEPQ